MDNINTDRFALIEFILVAISCTLLSIFPQFGWLPLIFALISIVFRALIQPGAFRLPRITLPILVFIATAIIAVWVAYNTSQALEKLYLILGSFLLFITVSNQPRRNLWLIFLTMGVYGFVAMTFFLFVYDWNQLSTDIGFIYQFSRWWMRFRPQFQLAGMNAPGFLQSISVDGLLAVLFPLNTAASIYSWRKDYRNLSVILIIINIGLGVGLLLTSSLTAWMAVFVGLVTWKVLYSLIQKKYFRQIAQLLPLLPILIIAFGILLPVIVDPRNPLVPAISTNLSSRLEISKNTLYLIGDFPFTGGGLNSFAGLYSQYILIIPHFLFNYSHNLFLDIALQQGILGLTLWGLIIYLTSSKLTAALLSQDNHMRGHYLFTTAIYSSVIIMLVYGIIDDPIYNSQLELLTLFLIPALAVTVSSKDKSTQKLISRYYKLGIVGTFLITAVITAILFTPTNAQWMGNIGAVKMAKGELSNWPTDKWDDSSNIASYSDTESDFNRAVVLQADQLTANYRLGLIWMARRDFQKASNYLETAIAEAPEHRGVIKSLGYCYTWLGSYEKAQVLLTQIPESQNELQTYVSWWKNLGRNDLAANAAEMVEVLSQ